MVSHDTILSFSAPECPGSHGAGSPAPKPAETAEACNAPAAPAPEMGQACASVDGGDPSGFP